MRAGAFSMDLKESRYEYRGLCSEYYDTDDTLRNALTVEVSEQVDMMEVWWRKRRSAK